MPNSTLYYLRILLFLFSFYAFLPVQATIIDYGVAGELFAVAEEDLREVLREHLKHLKQTGRIQQLEAAFRDKAEASVARPQPVANLAPTATPRTFTHDPTLVIDNTITDHQGKVLARAGDRINPLEHINLHKGLLFIDGDNIAQASWSKKHQDRFHIVLVNGSPRELSQNLGTNVYFDQGGHITSRYGIKQIPAILEQQGKLLRISEFKIEEEETR